MWFLESQLFLFVKIFIFLTFAKKYAFNENEKAILGYTLNYRASRVKFGALMSVFDFLISE